MRDLHLGGRVLAGTLAALLFSIAWAQPANTFTYQGRLSDMGVPAAGNFDMGFRLYDVPSGGLPLLARLKSGVSVVDGVFALQIDFADVPDLFENRRVWIEIDVGDAGQALSSLGPRTELTAAPQSNFALNSGSLDGYSANELVPIGAVVAFNLTECPLGWNLYEPAFGRFIRGIDYNGAGIDPDGTRIPGNVQDDENKPHFHKVPSNSGAAYSGGSNLIPWAGDPINGSPTTTVGMDESRPKNVALLYCERVG